MTAFRSQAWGWCIRTIGAVSVILAVWGFYFQILAVQRVVSAPNLDPNIPFFRGAFFTMIVVDAVILLGVAVVGIFMLMLRRKAATIYTWLVPSIIVLQVSVGGLWLLPEPWRRSIAAASGIGAVGVGPLLFYPVPLVYPILSTVVTYLAQRRLGQIED